MKTTIDLHDMRHDEAKQYLEESIDEIVYSGIPQDIEVITGNSIAMQNIAKQILIDYKLDYIVGDLYNKGYIRVTV